MLRGISARRDAADDAVVDPDASRRMLEACEYTDADDDPRDH